MLSYGFNQEQVDMMKKHGFITTEFVSDERGLVAWKLEKDKAPQLHQPKAKDEDGNEIEDMILYTEEVLAMIF